jgi:BirA family transcriptional regulator, biotin operon repressor / biotin---[acetyl-CoA-carboxylase] ligase
VGEETMTGLSEKLVERLESPLATRVELHDEIASTQERARELAREGAPHGTLVVSKVQTGGRGRLGRRWGSPAGGLWMSLVLRPNISAKAAARTTQMAAVAVAKALREFGVEARIKWPNDLLVKGRKICGILAESSVENVPVAAKRVGPGAERPVDFIILGVGLNANVDPQDLGVPDREVATLRSELGHDVDLLELLGSLLSHLEAELGRIEDFGAILDDWRTLDCTLGERVRVRRFGEVLEGVALDLGPEGELLLKTRDGVVELFEGEIEQLRQERI